MVKIFQVGTHKALREKAKPVPVKDIGTRKIAKIIKNMKEALAFQEDGVALAAPQIGLPLRIFVVSGRAFSLLNEEDYSPEKYPDKVFINPKILKTSKKKMWMEEGCLSVRKKYGKVKRSQKTTIEAYDENGQKFIRGGSNLLSQIFQHETDHLEGGLFIDKAKEIENIE